MENVRMSTQHSVANDFTSRMKRLRQSRQFLDKPIPAEIVRELLEVARWSGSSKNTQPWEFVVVNDRETIRELSQAGAYTQFLDGSALVIVIVLDGVSERSEAYDEGRLSERLMLAADTYGIGSGTGWFSTPDAQQRVRDILGIPEDRAVWQAVAFGYADPARSQRATSAQGGRKPLEELASYGRYGQRTPQNG
jgi:nitroreductase